jgi:hypothetical protein
MIAILYSNFQPAIISMLAQCYLGHNRQHNGRLLPFVEALIDLFFLQVATCPHSLHGRKCFDLRIRFFTSYEQPLEV